MYESRVNDTSWESSNFKRFLEETDNELICSI
jgi:hypothetical protein